MSLVVVVAAGLGFSAAGSYEVVLLSRIVLCLGTGAIITSCIKLLHANYPSDKIAGAIGFFATVWGLGFIFTFIAIPVIMAFSGWRAGLYLTAALGIAVLAVMPFFLKAANTGVGTHRQVVNGRASYWKKRMPLSRNLVIGTVVLFAGLSVKVGTLNWAAMYLQEKHQIALVLAGTSAAIIGVTNMLGALTSGFISSRFGKKGSY